LPAVATSELQTFARRASLDWTAGGCPYIFSQFDDPGVFVTLVIWNLVESPLASMLMVIIFLWSFETIVQ
jgi:hypothetical protein